METVQPFLLNQGYQPILHGDREPAALKAQHVSRWMLVILGLLMLIPAFAVWEWLAWLRLQVGGVTVAATVAGLVIDDNDEGHAYFVVYSLTAPTADGFKVFSNRQQIAESTYRTLQVGGSIPVRYLRDNPANSALAEENHTRAVASLVGLIGLAVCIFFGFATRRGLREHRLLRDGQLLEGRLLSCTGASQSSEDGECYIIHVVYHFAAPTGRGLRDRAKAQRNDLLNTQLPEPNTPMAVLYLDDRTYMLL